MVEKKEIIIPISPRLASGTKQWGNGVFQELCSVLKEFKEKVIDEMKFSEI